MFVNPWLYLLRLLYYNVVAIIVQLVDCQMVFLQVHFKLNLCYKIPERLKFCILIPIYDIILLTHRKGGACRHFLMNFWLKIFGGFRCHEVWRSSLKLDTIRPYKLKSFVDEVFCRWEFYFQCKDEILKIRVRKTNWILNLIVVVYNVPNSRLPD